MKEWTRHFKISNNMERNTARHQRLQEMKVEEVAMSPEYIEAMKVTRAEAKARGLTKYWTGKPCKRGHIDFRWTVGTCCTCGLMKDRKATKRQNKMLLIDKLNDKRELAKYYD